jgi:DNA-binding FadR family transcriptional regulator
LKAQDPLPQESAMMIQYGVSRPTLREALRLLESQGLIKVRSGPGGGPTVGKPSPFHLARNMIPYLHLLGATYGDTLKAWVRTEQLLASLHH